MWKFVESIWTVRDNPRTVWAASGIIYAKNYVLVYIRPKWPWISGSQSGTDVGVSSREQ